jgi:hypothetical protein
VFNTFQLSYYPPSTLRPSRHTPSGFTTQILLASPFLPMHASYPAYLIVLDLANLILKPPIMPVLGTVKSQTNVSQCWFFPISHSWCTVTRYLTLSSRVKCAQYYITAPIFHTTPRHLRFWYVAIQKANCINFNLNL